MVLVDRSHWGRLRVSGADRLKFLHGQSTAHFTGLQPGQGVDTVCSFPKLAHLSDVGQSAARQTKERDNFCSLLFLAYNQCKLWLRLLLMAVLG